jgi:iron complex outermembrane receptor protein
MPSLSSPVRPLTLAVCAALAALSAVSAFADEARLGEVLVSSGRDSAAPVNLPASQAGMSAAQLAAAVNVINSEDVVKYLPSVQVRKRYIGDRNSIIATRTSGQTSSARSLVYADGVLLSNLLGNRYDFPPRWNMVSADEISRVDMVYGPFAAEFPGNSVGSVVVGSSHARKAFSSASSNRRSGRKALSASGPSSSRKCLTVLQ